MKSNRRIRYTISMVIFTLSGLFWVLLLFNPGDIMTIEHCHISASGPSATSLNMLLAMNPISSQLIGWELMVVAMMLPKLIAPVQFICLQSLKRLRFTLSSLFVLGYLITWMFAGILMIGIIITFNLFFPLSYLPALTVFVVAVVWQFSPLKQRLLNLGHDHRIIAAFGWNAMKDATVFGLIHGLWCVGSGWALMLFPMLLPQGHNLAMLAVTFIMISEHAEHPDTPKWKFNLRLKLFKYLAAQTSIRLKQMIA